MREIFTEIFENQPLDPTEAARQTLRPRLRKRFYKQANVGDAQDGAGISLDGRPVLTPRRRAFVAPTQAMAAAIAAEWNAQTEFIDPRQMPLTRLANAAIDAVAENPQPVADEITKYLGSDLLFYRAESPSELIDKQSRSVGSGAFLGARGLRCALCVGARCGASTAAARSHCGYAKVHSARALAACGGFIDHHANRLRDSWRWQLRMTRSIPIPPGQQRTSMRIGKWRNGVATSSRSSVAPIAKRSSGRRCRCYVLSADMRPMRPRWV